MHRLGVVATGVLRERGRAGRHLVSRGGVPDDLPLLEPGGLTDDRQQPGLALLLDRRLGRRLRIEVAAEVLVVAGDRAELPVLLGGRAVSEAWHLHLDVVRTEAPDQGLADAERVHAV